MCYVAICCIDMCTILLYLVSTCAAFCYILYRLFWNGVEFVGYMENKQTNQELDEEQARSVFVRIIKHLSTCLLIYFDGPDISQKPNWYHRILPPHRVPDSTPYVKRSVRLGPGNPTRARIDIHVN